MSFKDIAIDASRKYYEYLKNNNGSLIKYDVIQVACKDNYCFLKLKTKPRSLDMLQIKINTVIYSDEEIKIVEYKSKSNVLKLSADKQLLLLLSKTMPREIQVIVDLKFLIKNIERFYMHYGDLLSLPVHTPSIGYSHTYNQKYTPSDEQLYAIDCALNNPLSYIWGAPGTGKTRFVLAQCILAYFKQFSNPKLLITAPTNNAVEQILFGILPVLKANNIASTKVLRLGTASFDFASLYPECCEHKSIERQAEVIRERIKEIDEEISQYTHWLSYHDTYESYVNLEKEVQSCQKRYDELYGSFCQIFKQFRQSNKHIGEINDKMQFFNSQIDVSKTKVIIIDNNIKIVQSQCVTLSEKINTLTSKLNENDNGLIKIFHKKKKIKLTEELERQIEAYNQCTHKLDELLQQKNDLQIQIDNFKKEYESFVVSLNIESDQLSIQYTEFNRLKASLISNTQFHKKPNTTAEQIPPDSCISDLEELQSKIKQINDEIDKKKKELYDDAVPPKENILGLISSLTKQKDTLIKNNEQTLSMSTSVRMEECSVIATTMDICITRILPNSDFSPMHIFLDEAGYCPFIKAAALLAYHAPITLLGDHMQLPPVCEMDPETLDCEHLAVVLYSLPAIYIENYEESIDYFVNLYYRTSKTLNLQYTAYAELNHSFRFGENLAKVLANTVYSANFIGSVSHTTRIHYIHSPKKESSSIRINQSEADNIYQLLHMDIDIDLDFDSLAILTPYKRQVSLLKSFLSIENVLTIHQSQGREWNTVILSVVDTTNKWFTNSLLEKSKGKNVINTAVSRAKKDLIVVCDYNYWVSQRKQLIGQIVNIADEIQLK